MSVRRRLALYGTGVAAAGMFVFILLLSGLGANGVREDQDRNLAAMADAAAGSLERGEVTSAADRPLVIVDLRRSNEPFLLVLDQFGTTRYASGRIDGVAPRIPAAVVVEANEQGRSTATIATTSVAGVFQPSPAPLRVVARRWASATET
ncbi:MAG TPA: hypothetical protein VJP45_04955, partial [Candidatus Limnocylindria bacterium]|nr:hypothetical protein [Candidatus Limnocylindria bacterium]